MAIKFSEFNVGATTSDIDYLVGYKNTDNVQIPVGLVGANTTYTVSTAQAGANETITLTGSDSSTDLITITAGNDISLTDDGAGNGFTIASTVVGDTYTIGTSTNGSSVDVNLDAAAGADSNITLTPVGGITITQAADVITIDSTAVNGTVTSVGTTTTDIAALTLSGTVTTAGDLNLAKTGGTAGQYIDGASGAWTTLPAGDTYSLQAGAKSGTSVPLNLDAATGSDSAVSLTEGTGITLTQTSATEITIDAANNGTVTEVSSADTNLITVADGTTTPAISAVTGAVSPTSTSLATGAQIQTAINAATGGIGVSVISSDTSAVSANLYVFTANLTLTLPSSPTVGNFIKVSNRSGVATCVVARNGENIMGSATDLTVNNLNAGFEMIYTGATQGWVLISVEGTAV